MWRNRCSERNSTWRLNDGVGAACTQAGVWHRLRVSWSPMGVLGVGPPLPPPRTPTMKMMGMMARKPYQLSPSRHRPATCKTDGRSAAPAAHPPGRCGHRVVVAHSGGKDSTAMVLRLKEIEPDQHYIWCARPRVTSCWKCSSIGAAWRTCSAPP